MHGVYGELLGTWQLPHIPNQLHNGYQGKCTVLTLPVSKYGAPIACVCNTAEQVKPV